MVSFKGIPIWVIPTEHHWPTQETLLNHRKTAGGRKGWTCNLYLVSPKSLGTKTTLRAETSLRVIACQLVLSAHQCQKTESSVRRKVDTVYGIANAESGMAGQHVGVSLSFGSCGSPFVV